MKSTKNGRTLILKVALLLVIMSTFFATLTAQFAGGDGTEDNPWQIATAQNLSNIRQYLGGAHTNKYYIQTDDIDLGVTPWNEDTGWTPIGSTVAESFQGTYDGGGYIISNLTINRTGTNQGLFGYTVSAVIRNVGLEEINLTLGGGSNIGGLIGSQDVNTLVEKCYVSGTIVATGGNIVGGLIGKVIHDDCFVTNCYANVNVTRIPPGGFDTINPAFAGLIGDMTGGTLFSSFAYGKIATAQSTKSAAVVGSRTRAEIINIYWNSELSGKEFGVGREPDFPGNTTLEMLNRQTYQGFNFAGVWSIAQGMSYPYFDWQGGPAPVNIPGPRDLTGVGRNQSVFLSWESPVMETEPLGYIVYRDGQRVNDDLIEELEYLDTGLTNWQEYDYRVTAVFTVGESYFSNAFTVAPTAFAGGTGTQADPYQVATAEHLNNVRLALDSYYVQIEDIDIGVPPFNEGNGWVPIGSANSRFIGHYDGNHYLIKNLMIDRHGNVFNPARDQSLFGYVHEASLKRVIIEDADIDADDQTGILAGTLDNSIVERCSASGIISAKSQIGGITGRLLNGAQIKECYSNGTFYASNSNSQLGGLVGFLQNEAAILNSYSTAVLVGAVERVGGLVGATNTSGSITSSYATGWVTAELGDTDLGGLIGLNNQGVAIDCYWNIQTTGQLESVGGGEGRETEQMLAEDNYENWNFNEVWAITENVTYPYLRWQENASMLNYPTPFNFVAEAEHDDELIALSWDFAGTPSRYDIFRNNERISSVNHPTMSYNDTECTLYNEYSYYVKAVFIIGEEEGITLPSHTVSSVLMIPFSGGDGSEENPYEVRSPQQLSNIRYALNKNFIQTANINLGVAPWNQELGWETIGSDTFKERFIGTYDGQGFIISNLTINRPTEQYQGLFAYAYNAQLKNVVLEDLDIVCGNYSGGLVGFQDNSLITNCSSSGTLTTENSDIGGLVGKIGNTVGSQIISCYSSANVNGHLRTGGLVGHNANGEIIASWATGDVDGGGQMYAGGLVGHSEGDIRESFATGNVSGNATYRGGLVGVNSGTMTNCYARGNVRGSNYVGGLVGRNSGGQIIKCYSTGTAIGGTIVGGLAGSNTGDVENDCYWDIETSQRQTSEGGLGRTTRQMVYPTNDHETYVDWDFEDIWTDDIDGMNDHYPIFAYQFIRLDTPQVKIDIIEIDNVTHSRISWESIEGAQAYKIYASENPFVENWGEPINVIQETHFTEPVVPGVNRFYFVVAIAGRP